MERSCYHMSGIDEQEQTFKCPDCGDVSYWILNGQDEEGEVLLGFLNNPNVSDDPTVEIMKLFRDMSLHTMLVHIHKFKCGDCGYIPLLDSLTWKQVSDKIKEKWEKRAYI